MAKGYTTESLVEAEVLFGITSSTSPNSTQVAQWIEEAEERIDGWTNTSFTSTAVTNEICPFDTSSAFKGSHYQQAGSLRTDTRSSITFDTSFLTVNGNPIRPILTISSLYVNKSSPSQADDWTLLTEQTGSGGSFIVDYQTGHLTFLTDKPFYPTVRGIKWTGTYGYSSIPYKIQELATKMVAIRVLGARIKRSAVKAPNSVTMESISIQVQTSQMVTLMKFLQGEVESLKEDLINKYSVRPIR